MTERLADISSRLRGVRQLDDIVGAMRGIAAARAQQSRASLAGIHSYAEVIAQSIAAALRLIPQDGVAPSRLAAGKRGLIVFCAEQGFAGAFSSRVLDTFVAEQSTAQILLIGTRGALAAEERGLRVAWRTTMASHADGLAAVALRVGDALYESVRRRELTTVDLVFPVWNAGGTLSVERRPLLPIDLRRFMRPGHGDVPLTNLPAELLIDGLAEEYVHAQLREAATQSFVAENEARLATMASARGNIERMIDELALHERQVRQDEITAEVVELAGGTRSWRQHA